MTKSIIKQELKNIKKNIRRFFQQYKGENRIRGIDANYYVQKRFDDINSSIQKALEELKKNTFVIHGVYKDDVKVVKLSSVEKCFEVKDARIK